MKQEKPKHKYYLWSYSKSYGWTPTGVLEGYDTLEELEKENEHTIKTRKYSIYKSEEIGGSLK